MVTWIYGRNYNLKWSTIEGLRDEQIQQITLCAANFAVSKMSIHMAQGLCASIFQGFLKTICMYHNLFCTYRRVKMRRLLV